MKKKTLYGGTACIAAVGIVCSLLLGFYTEERKTEYIYEKVGEIISDEEELEKYGMEAKHLFYWPEMLAVSGEIGVVCIGMVILCIKYTKGQDQKIREMERYCEEILDGNETLDLRDNEEGQFSILKNKVHDITMMLREQNQSLEKNKKEMEQMIADISHQLKTPITSLNMIHDILYMDLPEDKKAEFLDNMQKDLIKIEWLVKTVLHMAKLDSGSLELEKREEKATEFSKEVQEHFKVFCEVNGSEILTEQAEGITLLCDRKWTREAREEKATEFSKEVQEHFKVFCEVNGSEILTEQAEGITLLCDRKWTREAVNNMATEFSKEVQEHFKVFCEVNGSEILTEQAEGITLLCDRKWTREAVNNIVKNAIEHGAKQVKLCWESNVLYTKLTITDDGEGIDREELPHIFERFYRTKNSKEDSLGLGLAFAKSIILHQNGEIKVQSKKGVGTTFHIFERFYRTKNSKEDSLGLGLAFAKSIILHQNGEIKVQSKKGVGTTFFIKFYKNLP